jgi:hypothetical protein
VRAAIGVVVVTLLVVVIWSPAWAGRPLVTEDTGTLTPGAVELELGLDYLREPDANVVLFPGPLAFNIGLLPRLELSVATLALLVDPDDAPSRAGAGDSAARLKYRFLDETDVMPALLASVAARFPSGDADRGLGERGVDVQALGAASKTFGSVTLTFNGGYTFATDDRDRDVVHVHASAEAALSREWSVVGEVVSDLATTRRADDRLVLRVGTVYAVNDRVRLDAAAGFGATRVSPDVVVTVGITVLLNPR